MNKRALHHTLVKLQLVTLWQLVIVLFVAGALSAVFLRQNNLHMLQLRNQLKQADEQNKDIPQALTNLGQYITTHMNTSMGDSGVYLQQSYERAYTQAIQKAAHGGTANEAVYQHADEDCQASFSRAMAFQGYIQCVSDEILASAGQEGLKALQVPAADLYRYNFISPAWSPDVAGVAVLATLLLTLLISSRVVLSAVLRLLLRQRTQAS